MLEALLSRVAVSKFREDFVLKGGVLLATFDLRRATKDIDLQAARIPNDVEAVTTRIKEIAGIHVDDGVDFALNSISAQTIRDEDEYSGVRVRIVGTVGRSVLPIGIDVSFGEPIWPEPTETVLPRLLDLGQEPVSLLGYPLPMIIAEKTVTAIQRGQANTRWRDYADILTISRRHRIESNEPLEVFDAVANHRQTRLTTLLPTLASMPPLAQSKWGTWRRRQAYENALPESFAVVKKPVASFVDPVIAHRTTNSSWDPSQANGCPRRRLRAERVSNGPSVREVGAEQRATWSLSVAPRTEKTPTGSPRKGRRRCQVSWRSTCDRACAGQPWRLCLIGRRGVSPGLHSDGCISAVLCHHAS